MAPMDRKADTEIEKHVLRELEWDPRVKETNIGVQVDQRIVTLIGTVLSYEAREAAQKAAHRVDGVLDVANDIQVHSPDSLVRPDAGIARAVREALESDVSVASDHIQSTVSNGWVTLEGLVDYLAQREAAEVAVRRLVGVQGVTNQIAVKSQITYQEV